MNQTVAFIILAGRWTDLSRCDTLYIIYCSKNAKMEIFLPL
jgi:hypothetical protein